MKTTYRGYQGHFIGKCRFHLNTLIDFEDPFIKNIIVSTVGQYIVNEKMEELGCDKDSLFETMVFNTQFEEVKIDKKIVVFEEIVPSEIECHRTKNEVEAQNMHDEIVTKYVEGKKERWVNE